MIFHSDFYDHLENCHIVNDTCNLAELPITVLLLQLNLSRAPLVTQHPFRKLATKSLLTGEFTIFCQGKGVTLRERRLLKCEVASCAEFYTVLKRCRDLSHEHHSKNKALPVGG